MPRHHIRPKHAWLKEFGNLKGVNAADNIVHLTVQQHQQAHLLLYELHHDPLDLEAANACTGILLKRNTNKLHGNVRRRRRRPQRNKSTTPKRKSRTTYRKFRI